ncbi:hypothetical protein [Microbispora sp. H13382]|uniref:hypothetical protein n=1 Tax=Microbispora sp. H13382 TaxID=2729112 RepID=UPI001602F87B|nr:hypothetical protein [Microbispora sp. H13382]
MPNDNAEPEDRIPERLPPLAQSPDAEPGAEPGGGSGDWHAAGADSPDDVDEPADD